MRWLAGKVKSALEPMITLKPPGQTRESHVRSTIGQFWQILIVVELFDNYIA
jgi:uncharacterized membrane protein (DUF373 family)